MEYAEFKQKMITALPVGTVLANPGGGTSKILRYTSDAVTYKRRNSPLIVHLQDIYSAYLRFRGRIVTSNDLKEYQPAVFDTSARPSGHDCNCTFLFLVLQRTGIVSTIEGKGVRGDPFYVVIPL